MTLTPKQEQVLTAVRSRTRTVRIGPEVSVIGLEVGLSSKCSVWRHLRTLEREGLITKQRLNGRDSYIPTDE